MSHKHPIHWWPPYVVASHSTTSTIGISFTPSSTNFSFLSMTLMITQSDGAEKLTIAGETTPSAAWKTTTKWLTILFKMDGYLYCNRLLALHDTFYQPPRLRRRNRIWLHATRVPDLSTFLLMLTQIPLLMHLPHVHTPPLVATSQLPTRTTFWFYNFWWCNWIHHGHFRVTSSDSWTK